MRLDPELSAILDALEIHGVTIQHLAMLLRLLQVQRNGSWAWHYVGGTIVQCDAKLTFPSRSYEISRVCETLLEGESFLR